MKLVRIGIFGLIIVTIMMMGTVLVAQDVKKDKPQTVETQTGKKFEFEFSLGIAQGDPSSVYDRQRGINSMVDQYAQYYNLSSTATGEFKETKLFFPFNIAVNYQLKEKMFLRFGIDYVFKSVSSLKSFDVSWSSFTERHDYALKNKVSYIMPHVGAGYKYKSFDFYGALGLAFASMTQDELLDYAEPGYGHDIKENISVSGTSPGLLLGAKYRLPLTKKLGGRNFSAFVKIEALILKISTLTGTRDRVAANSAGNSSTQTVDGTAYGFGYNPYSISSFDYWDIFEAEPTDGAYSNPKKLGLNLSGIRFMIGISF